MVVSAASKPGKVVAAIGIIAALGVAAIAVHPWRGSSRSHRTAATDESMPWSSLELGKDDQTLSVEFTRAPCGQGSARLMATETSERVTLTVLVQVVSNQSSGCVGLRTPESVTGDAHTSTTYAPHPGGVAPTIVSVRLRRRLVQRQVVPGPLGPTSA